MAQAWVARVKGQRPRGPVRPSTDPTAFLGALPESQADVGPRLGRHAALPGGQSVWMKTWEMRKDMVSDYAKFGSSPHENIFTLVSVIQQGVKWYTSLQSVPQES